MNPVVSYINKGDDRILDIYGIRNWIESLPEKKISITTLANSYKIIGLQTLRIIAKTRNQVDINSYKDNNSFVLLELKTDAYVCKNHVNI